jgi:hypothetical protein
MLHGTNHEPRHDVGLQVDAKKLPGFGYEVGFCLLEVPFPCAVGIWRAGRYWDAICQICWYPEPVMLSSLLAKVHRGGGGVALAVVVNA